MPGGRYLAQTPALEASAEEALGEEGILSPLGVLAAQRDSWLAEMTVEANGAQDGPGQILWTIDVDMTYDSSQLGKLETSAHFVAEFRYFFGLGNTPFALYEPPDAPYAYEITHARKWGASFTESYQHRLSPEFYPSYIVLRTWILLYPDGSPGLPYPSLPALAPFIRQYATGHAVPAPSFGVDSLLTPAAATPGAVSSANTGGVPGAGVGSDDGGSVKQNPMGPRLGGSSPGGGIHLPPGFQIPGLNNVVILPSPGTVVSNPPTANIPAGPKTGGSSPGGGIHLPPGFQIPGLSVGPILPPAGVVTAPGSDSGSNTGPPRKGRVVE